MTIPVNDATTLSRLFHLNSEPWLNEDAYRGEPYHQEFKEHCNAPRTPLPPFRSGRVSNLAQQRKSVRAYAPSEMSLRTLGDLLHACYGIAEVAPLQGGGSFLRRNAPSAGGLYPLELYPMVQRIEGIEDGIYHFDVCGDALELVQPGDWQKSAPDVFYTWPFVAEANAIVCFSAVFERTQKKYGPRGYRYILLEAGHAAQTLCLAAEEMGLATLCMGGYRDSMLGRMMGLDTSNEGVVYAVAVGEGA